MDVQQAYSEQPSDCWYHKQQARPSSMLHNSRQLEVSLLDAPPTLPLCISTLSAVLQSRRGFCCLQNLLQRLARSSLSLLSSALDRGSKTLLSTRSTAQQASQTHEIIMPRSKHHNNHNRGSVRSIFPTSDDQDSFESLAGLTQGKGPSVQSSPKGSVSLSPRRTERASPAPDASSVYSTRPNSAASASVFSNGPRKSSSASSNNSPNQTTVYSLTSLPPNVPASNRSASGASDSSFTNSIVEALARESEIALTNMKLSDKKSSQIQNRKLQIAEQKARARAEAKAQRKKPVPRAASREHLHRLPSSHRGSTSSGNYSPYGRFPSGLSSRTQSALSSGSRSTSFDSYGNPRRLSSVSDGSSCDDGSVISGGSGLIEIDPWAENITENFNSTTIYSNPALTQGITKTGVLKWRSGKSKNIKPQFVACNGGVHARTLPSDDGASSSSSEEMIVTPQVAILRGRTRTTKALPERFHYKSGDVEHNRKANTQMKKEYGAKRGGEASIGYRYIRHTTDDDLEILGSRLE